MSLPVVRQCPNCGSTTFHEIEDDEFPYLMLTPCRKNSDGVWEPNPSKGMVVSAYTCVDCRNMMFFEKKGK